MLIYSNKSDQVISKLQMCSS